MPNLYRRCAQIDTQNAAFWNNALSGYTNFLLLSSQPATLPSNDIRQPTGLFLALDYPGKSNIDSGTFDALVNEFNNLSTPLSYNNLGLGIGRQIAEEYRDTKSPESLDALKRFISFYYNNGNPRDITAYYNPIDGIRIVNDQNIPGYSNSNALGYQVAVAASMVSPADFSSDPNTQKKYLMIRNGWITNALKGFPLINPLFSNPYYDLSERLHTLLFWSGRV